MRSPVEMPKATTRAMVVQAGAAGRVLVAFTFMMPSSIEPATTA
ncbi:hypothetical protein [Mycobacterium sp. 852002-51057_SCH5723018]|nr:hypothetical protein [Mycobacterium sp. 852002-51057_SCH5723018]